MEATDCRIGNQTNRSWKEGRTGSITVFPIAFRVPSSSCLASLFLPFPSHSPLSTNFTPPPPSNLPGPLLLPSSPSETKRMEKRPVKLILHGLPRHSTSIISSLLSPKYLIHTHINSAKHLDMICGDMQTKRAPQGMIIFEDFVKEREGGEIRDVAESHGIRVIRVPRGSILAGGADASNGEKGGGMKGAARIIRNDLDQIDWKSVKWVD